MKKNSRLLPPAILLLAAAGTAALWIPKQKDLRSKNEVPSDVSGNGSAPMLSKISPAIRPTATTSMVSPKLYNSVVDTTLSKSIRCFGATNKARALKNAINLCLDLADAKGAETLFNECASKVDQDKERMKSISLELAGCPSDEKVERDIFEATREAAKLGNKTAQICYIQSSFSTSEKGLSFSLDERSQYVNDASKYAMAALRRGDWRIVPLLGARVESISSGMLPYIAKGDPYTRFEMNRLLRLGAYGPYAQFLDSLSQQEFLQPGISAGPALNAAQAAGATAHAENLYKKYFSGAPALSAQPISCP